MDERPKILIVDDKVENLFALEKLLADLDVEFVRATSGNEALKKTLEEDFAITLVDVQMPGMEGFEMVELLRQHKKTRHLPVIFLSAIYKEDFHQVKGIETGAVDFITKPVVPEILVGKIRVFLDLHQNKKSMENEIIRRRESEEALKKSEKGMIKLNEQLKENLQELKISEERFKSLVITIPDIVYRIDREGYFTFVNDAIKRLGYEPVELLSQHFSEIILHPDPPAISRSEVLLKYKGKITGDKDAPKLLDERRTGARKTTGLEVRLVSKKGKLEPGLIEKMGEEIAIVEINSAGIYGIQTDQKAKVFIGTVGVIRDISDRKQMEKALKESEQRLKTILEYTEAGILVIEPEKKKIVEANPAAARMLGLPISEIMGSICDQFDCSNDKKKCPVTDKKEKVISVEQSLLQANGNTITVLKTVAPIILNNRNHLLESFVDISKLKQAEEELKKTHAELEIKVEERTAELKHSQSQLIQAEKVAALGTLTAGIAHELNNPMMGMLNFIQYCLKKTTDEGKIVEVLKDAEHETRRCIDIVKNLLTFSRIERDGEEKPQKTNLARLTDRVLRLLAYRIEKENVSISNHIAENTPEIWVRVSNMQQVFLNLIGNSLDALKAEEKKEIRIDIRPRGEFVRVTISDTGPGIDPEIFSKIFDPFFTTKPPGKGTGLGLSVSQSIVKTHGGEIVCDSEVDNGSVFKILLPIERNLGIED